MLSSFDRDPSERACFTQRWAKLAHRLADCSASMSDGSDSDRDNEPLSALTAKQGKGKSKIVVDSSYDKAVKKSVLCVSSMRPARLLSAKKFSLPIAPPSPPSTRLHARDRIGRAC